LLKERSRIIVFHHNLSGRRFDEDTFVFTRGLFPDNPALTNHLCGIYLSILIIRWYSSRLTALNLARPAGVVALAGILAICAPLSRLVAKLEERRKSAPVSRSMHEHDDTDRLTLMEKTASDNVRTLNVRTLRKCAASADFC
jgi:hypothetical protein